MLRFAVFNQDGPATEWPIRHPFVVATDGSIVPGEVRFEDGHIVCQRDAEGSTAVGMLFETDSVGAVWLQTCLLPSTNRPYLYSLELARHRLMLFLVKAEQWMLTDLPPDDPISTLFERARATFTRALVAGSGAGVFSVEQARLSRQALELGLQAGEMLAERAAGATLASRLSLRGESAGARPQWFGVGVAPDRFAEPLCKVVAGAFDFINAPMRWTDLEPEEGAYAFARTDRWVEWAVLSAKIPVVGGPLIDFRPGATPDWLSIWEHDYETLRDLVFEHIRLVVKRYRKAISRWTVVSGIHTNDHFTLSIEQVVDLTRTAVLAVRKLQPNARVSVELVQPWSESRSVNPAAIPAHLYAELLAQAEINVDTLGLRIQMGEPALGGVCRDMLSVSDMLDNYASFERPIAITAVSAPSAPLPIGESPLDPGYVGEPWSEQSQAAWLSKIVTCALGKPYVTSVCWQSLYDVTNPGELPMGGLITAQGVPKMAMNRARAVYKVLHATKPGHAAAGANPADPAGGVVTEAIDAPKP
jgi:hypothetical protein